MQSTNAKQNNKKKVISKPHKRSKSVGASPEPVRFLNPESKVHYENFLKQYSSYSFEKQNMLISYEKAKPLQPNTIDWLNIINPTMNKYQIKLITRKSKKSELKGVTMFKLKLQDRVFVL